MHQWSLREPDACLGGERGFRCGILPHGWVPTPLKGFKKKKFAGGRLSIVKNGEALGVGEKHT